jgi:hypothetical protein
MTKPDAVSTLIISQNRKHETFNKNKTKKLTSSTYRVGGPRVPAFLLRTCPLFCDRLSCWNRESSGPIRRTTQRQLTAFSCAYFAVQWQPWDLNKQMTIPCRLLPAHLFHNLLGVNRWKEEKGEKRKLCGVKRSSSHSLGAIVGSSRVPEQVSHTRLRLQLELSN